MKREGRGLIIGSCLYASWKYLFEESTCGLTGTIKSEGWKEISDMAAWFDANRGKTFTCELADGSIFEIVASGMRMHESGHYSESSLKITGKSAKQRNDKGCAGFEKPVVSG